MEAAETEPRAMHCCRHRLFFDYGVLLARAGFGRSEIQGKLREIAGRETKISRRYPESLNHWIITGGLIPGNP